MILSLGVCAQERTNFDSTNVQGVRQDSVFKYVSYIPGHYSSIDIDVLDNIYLMTERNTLKKIKPNGDSTGVFNDVKKYGNPTMIDVTNPLKTLVYYKGFATVVVLDRFITFLNSINLRKENIFRVQTLATSYDNNIWIFDEGDLKLKKIDYDGKVLSETSDMRQIFDEVPQPTQITDRDNLVYLYDPNKGFFIFDYYGSYKNTLPFLKWEHTAVSKNMLMGFIGNTFYSYELNSLRLKSYKLPAFFKDYDDIKAMNGRVYLLKKNGVEVYSIL